MKISKYIILVVVNVFFISVIFFILDYLNVYFNANLIPNSLKWDESGHLKESLEAFKVAQIVVSNIESLICIILFYFFNKWFLTKVVRTENARLLALWFSILLFVGTLIMLFKHYNSI